MRSSVEHGDFAAFVTSLEEVRAVRAWRKALLTIRCLSPPPAPFRERALALWSEEGDEFRKEIYAEGGYRLLADALSVLLPFYQGEAMRLWRGSTAWGRRRSVYGLAWSRSKSVADAFARGAAQRYPDGSVLLETVAPAAAIICIVPHSDLRGEKEVLVDHRHLTAVQVVSRYHTAAPVPDALA